MTIGCFGGRLRRNRIGDDTEYQCAQVWSSFPISIVQLRLVSLKHHNISTSAQMYLPIIDWRYRSNQTGCVVEKRIGGYEIYCEVTVFRLGFKLPFISD